MEENYRTEGLSAEDVKKQIYAGKVNRIADVNERTFKDIVKENTLTYFNLIFAVLAFLNIIAGQIKNLTFLIAVIFNAVVGIIQEWRAKKTLDELNVMNQAQAKVLRSGQTMKIPVDKLVLSDVIILEAGDQIPADALIVSGDVNVNESLLTGESDDIEKHEGSELMSGSFVVTGKCLARLIRVGEDSYISKLTAEAKKVEKEEKSDMVRDIDRIILVAGILIIPVGIALLVQGMMEGNGFSTSISSMTASVIGMIPEGLYILVTLRLALSTIKLSKKKVLLHSMKSIETLARVDVMCVDKTGTITDNVMTVRDVRTFGGGDVEALIGGYIRAVPDNNDTMQALRAYFKEGESIETIEVKPFSSKYKFSEVTTPEGTYRLGAPEMLLGKEGLEDNEDILGAYEKEGLRSLAFVEMLEGKVRLLGFIAIENHIREDAVKVFKYFKEQDVNIIVISGDNPKTVSQIAKRAGIENAGQYINAMDLKTREDIKEAVSKYTVFGRVSPEQKKMIVEELQALGQKVAMTGDGVNDILAMKEADCSIAMGSGSEAAKQAAQVVLLDSDFSKMPLIVAEGRQDINNIERSAALFLVKNIFSFLLGIFSVIMLDEYPLQPTQISLLSTCTIGIPAFLLALEKNTKRQEDHFLRRVIIKALPAALTNFIVVAAIASFGEVFGISTEDISVAATILMAVVGMAVLYRISKPMDTYRVAVLVLSIALLFVTVLTLGDFFEIRNISYQGWMLLVIFIIMTEPLMRYLSRFVEWIESLIRVREEKKEKQEEIRHRYYD